MILKLRTVEFRTKKFRAGWELISDITSFRYAKVDKEDEKNFTLNSSIRSLDKNGRADEKNTNYVYIQAWHKRSSEPLNIITNMVAYMLNDEGKTIERIN